MPQMNTYTIPITLTSIKDPSDRRHITLTAGQPCIIGRASRSRDKDVEATSYNALFDCPVISRKHAKLLAHPWAASGDQVQLVDAESMHGTRVNGVKLIPNKAWSLRSGDTIQFGERVTRGEDTHEGVIVTFDKQPLNSSQLSHTMAPSQMSTRSGYSVPDISDGEEDYESDHMSDYDDDEIISIISDEDHEEPSSSAKTTPEQGKARIGSQEKPIDLETFTGAARKTDVINLEDDDDDEDRVSKEYIGPDRGFGGKCPRLVFDSLKVVQDSVDQDNPIYEPKTLANLSRAPLPSSSKEIREKLGLANMLDDKESERLSDVESEFDDEVEYDDGEKNDDEDAGTDYDNESSQCYNYSPPESPHDIDDIEDVEAVDEGDMESEEEEEDEEPLTQSSKKQPSPELGSPIGTTPALGSAPSPRKVVTGHFYEPTSPVLSRPAAQSQPVMGFDTRGITYPFPPPRPFAPSTSSTKPVMRSGCSFAGPSTYTYAPSNIHPQWSSFGIASSGTDRFNSSRWDIPPPPPPPPGPPPPLSAFALGARPPLPPPPHMPSSGIFDDPFYAADPKQSNGPPRDGRFHGLSSSPTTAQSPPVPDPFRMDPAVPFGFQQPWVEAAPFANGPEGFDLSTGLYMPPPSPIPNFVVNSAKKSTKPATPAPVQPIEPVSSPLKSKISITDIVENNVAPTREAKAEESVAAAPKKSTPTGAKRKAQEITTDGIIGDGVQDAAAQKALTDLFAAKGLLNNPKSIKAPTSLDLGSSISIPLGLTTSSSATYGSLHGLDESTPMEPPVQRRKINKDEDAASGRGVKEVAKYAGGALLGGVATMAFLVSPLCEKAIEWLA